MVNRYSQLRSAIAVLAASPQIQVDWLDQHLAPLTLDGNAEAYGNIELIETFTDIFYGVAHMLEHEELTKQEINAISRLDMRIKDICAQEDERLWERNALFSDGRWQTLRSLAAEVLAQLPDEERESDYTRALRDNGS